MSQQMCEIFQRAEGTSKTNPEMIIMNQKPSWILAETLILKILCLRKDMKKKSD